MRGGISYISKRHSKANNKFMKSDDNSEENKYITYLDANNLYGLATSQYFPYSEFINIVNQKEINGFCLNSIGENSSIGYILEDDLKYSDYLHELHNDDLLAPEKLEISQNKLSNYCCNIASYYEIRIGGVSKLVQNLGNKSKYVAHCKNLQFYLSLGMKLTKVHRILKFKKSDWLKK